MYTNIKLNKKQQQNYYIQITTANTTVKPVNTIKNMYEKITSKLQTSKLTPSFRMKSTSNVLLIMR